MRTFKGVRSDLDLTQKKMAEMLGITETQYKAIEVGDVVTPASVFIQMLNVGNINDFRDLKIPKEK